MDTNVLMPYAVYGSLRPGCGNDVLWHGRAVASEQSFRVEGFRLVTSTGLGYPFALRSSRDSICVDLIYPKSEWAFELRKDLDRLEGYPDFYTRTSVNVEGVTALLYLPAEPQRYSHLQPVLDGDWTTWVQFV